MGLKYLFSPITPVADKTGVSHRAGWALYWAEELGAKLITTKDMAGFADQVKKGDEVYVYHGMEFKGKGINFPGGPPPSLAPRVEMLYYLAKKLKVDLISLDMRMPRYGALLKATGLDADLLDSLDKAITKASAAMIYPSEDPARVIIGDSHTVSQYTDNSRILRMDGQTLFTALNHGLQSYVDWLFHDTVPKSVKTITFYLGNIDIRHHLLRHSHQATHDLIDEYVRQLKELAKTYKKIQIEVVQPLPIEDEARTVPKTGWYKGTPFFGSWKQRTEIQQLFSKRLVDHQLMGAPIRVYQHPKHFLNDFRQLSYDVMEKPRSVHIRPDCYRHILEGGSWTSVT